MEFTVKKIDIVNILKNASGIASAKTELSITECVKIETSGSDRILITATDIQTAYSKECYATVISHGIMVINASVLFSICQTADDEISVKRLENRWLEISSGKSVFNIATMPEGDFPDVSVGDTETALSVKKDDVIQALKRAVAIPGQNDDKRAHITSANLKYSDGRLTVTSTDGSRLSCSEIDAELTSGETLDFLLYKQSLKNVLRIFSDAEHDIDIKQAGNHIIFSCETTSVSVRITEGDFPNTAHFKNMLDSCGKIEIDRKTFRKAMGRASAMASENHKGCRFILEASGTEIALMVTNPDAGEFKENVPVTSNRFRLPVEFCMNIFYIGNALDCIVTENAVMGITGSDKGIFFMDEDSEKFYMVIMPMRP